MGSAELDIHQQQLFIFSNIITYGNAATPELTELIREEIERIERRPPSRLTEAQNPIESPQEIKIPLKREEAQVTKKPYVKEEVIVKKKTITNNKEITEDITSEELDTSNVERE